MKKRLSDDIVKAALAQHAQDQQAARKHEAAKRRAVLAHFRNLTGMGKLLKLDDDEEGIDQHAYARGVKLPDYVLVAVISTYDYLPNKCPWLAANDDPSSRPLRSYYYSMAGKIVASVRRTDKIEGFGEVTVDIFCEKEPPTGYY